VRDFAAVLHLTYSLHFDDVSRQGIITIFFGVELITVPVIVGTLRSLKFKRFVTSMCCQRTVLQSQSITPYNRN